MVTFLSEVRLNEERKWFIEESDAISSVYIESYESIPNLNKKLTKEQVITVWLVVFFHNMQAFNNLLP